MIPSSKAAQSNTATGIQKIVRDPSVVLARRPCCAVCAGQGHARAQQYPALRSTKYFRGCIRSGSGFCRKLRRAPSACSPLTFQTWPRRPGWVLAIQQLHRQEVAKELPTASFVNEPARRGFGGESAARASRTDSATRIGPLRPQRTRRRPGRVQRSDSSRSDVRDGLQQSGHGADRSGALSGRDERAVRIDPARRQLWRSVQQSWIRAAAAGQQSRSGISVPALPGSRTRRRRRAAD